MAIRVGINGFGRIGRAILRLSHGDPEIEIVQINDLAGPASQAHAVKYDSVHGTFAAKVERDADGILVDGKKILVTAGKEPSQISWSDSGAQIVLECTGKFVDRPHGEDHLRSGPQKVIVSAPGKGSDLTVVMGVNHQAYQPDQHRIISNASCTTNCLAPLAKLLDENYRVVRGFMTTVHSYTNDQRIIDGTHKDLRRARAAGLNQIPTSTGAAKAIGEVLPQLKGKLEGMSIRVPTPNVSLVDLVVDVEQACTAAEVNTMFQQAAQGELQGIIDYSDLPLVSSDYNGSRFSAVVDGLSTAVLEGKLLKVLAWYDNESGFSQRMIDLTKHVGKTLG